MNDRYAIMKLNENSVILKKFIRPTAAEINEIQSRPDFIEWSTEKFLKTDLNESKLLCE